MLFDPPKERRGKEQEGKTVGRRASNHDELEGECLGALLRLVIHACESCCPLHHHSWDIVIKSAWFLKSSKSRFFGGILRGCESTARVPCVQDWA